MQCKKCNKSLPDGSKFCCYCGAKVSPPESKYRRTRGNGQGTVFLGRDKTYWAQYTVGWEPYVAKDGAIKHRRKVLTRSGFKTKKDALAALEKLKAAPVSLSTPTMQQVYDKWHALHEKDVAHGTMLCYEAAWNYYKPVKFYKIADVKTAPLQACLDSCGKGKRTQQNMKALMTMLYRYAMENDLVEKNYGEYLRPHGDTQGPREPFTSEELDLMWKKVKEVPNLDLVLILCYTGFRVEELLNLKGSDFHTEKDFSYFIGGEKTDAGRNRIVGISPKILPYVKARLVPGYIFGTNGKKISGATFRDTVYYPALAAAGLPKRVPHCCRHTFATLMKSVNAPDKDKMAIIGHTSMSMTNHYTHTDLASIQAISDAL